MLDAPVQSEEMVMKKWLRSNDPLFSCRTFSKFVTIPGMMMQQRYLTSWLTGEEWIQGTNERAD
jgi:hypothetical protein